jgi:uncharacterized protein (DUF488 family)
MPTVYTVGHSNKPLADFIDLLTTAGIEVIVDVRSRPSSRFNPWFNRNSLSAELPPAGIRYLWMGNQLGGLDGNVNFEEGVDQVLGMAKLAKVAVMCSEGPTTKCHRRYMLTPEFQARRFEVMDVNWDGTVTPAASHVKHDTPVEEVLF